MPAERVSLTSPARVLAALLVAALLVLGLAGDALAAPRLSVSPTAAPPGATVKVTAAGHPRRAPGSLALRRMRLASFRTTGSGRFVARFVVPRGRAGATAVVARVGSTRVSRRFRVLAAPRPAAPGPVPATDPATAAPAVLGRATTRPVGATVLGDAQAAARVTRSPWEPRPENAVANVYAPSASELVAFFARTKSWGACGDAYRDRITGAFTGTTDEVLQWAAHKWGIDEDVVRAVATKESWWRTSALGDAGESFGLMQIRLPYNPGTHPLSATSTAFNVDYWAASIRQYVEGCSTWLDQVERGRDYAPGDLWGAIGAWFSGRWHTPPAEEYIGAIQANLAERPWLSPSFR